MNSTAEEPKQTSRWISGLGIFFFALMIGIIGWFISGEKIKVGDTSVYGGFTFGEVLDMGAYPHGIDWIPWACTGQKGGRKIYTAYFSLRIWDAALEVAIER